MAGRVRGDRRSAAAAVASPPVGTNTVSSLTAPRRWVRVPPGRRREPRRGTAAWTCSYSSAPGPEAIKAAPVALALAERYRARPASVLSSSTADSTTGMVEQALRPFGLSRTSG